MSVFFSYSIKIKNQDNEKLVKELFIKKNNSYYFNCKYLNTDKIYEKMELVYKMENNYLKIMLGGNKVFAPVEELVKKFKEDIVISTYSECDVPWETGKPYLEETYIEYKNGKEIVYTTTDLVINDVKETIRKNGNLYEFLKELYSKYNEDKVFSNTNDYDTLLSEAIIEIPKLYCLFSEKKKKDVNFNIEVLGKNFEISNYISDEMKSNKEILNYIVNKYLNKKISELISEDVIEKILDLCKDERERNFIEVRLKRAQIWELDEETRKDKEKMLTLAREGLIFEYTDSIDKSLWEDKSFVLEFIKTDASYFSELDEKYKDDNEIALEAVRKDIRNLSFVSNRLKNDENFVKEATT